MFRDDRPELAHIRVERFASAIEAGAGVRSRYQERGPSCAGSYERTSGAFSRRWIEGTSFYGGSGLTEERQKVS